MKTKQSVSGQIMYRQICPFGLTPFRSEVHVEDEIWRSGGAFSTLPSPRTMHAFPALWAADRRTPCFAFTGMAGHCLFFGQQTIGPARQIAYSEYGCPTVTLLVPANWLWDGMLDRAKRLTYESTSNLYGAKENAPDEHGDLPVGSTGLLSITPERESVEEWIRSWNTYASKRSQGVTISIHWTPTSIKMNRGQWILIRISAGIYGDHFMGRLIQSIEMYRQLTGDLEYGSTFIN